MADDPQIRKPDSEANGAHVAQTLLCVSMCAAAFIIWSHPAVVRSHIPVVVQEQVDWKPVMKEVQTTLKKQWAPPRDTVSRQCIVKFKLHRDGTVGNVIVAKPSGSLAADEAALKAVRTAKLNPLPPGAFPDVDIEFGFDYNALDENGKRIDSGRKSADADD